MKAPSPTGLYKIVAGIQPATPATTPSGSPPPREPVSTTLGEPLATRYGSVECRRQRTTDGYIVDVLVPHHTRTELVLPDKSVHPVPARRHTFTSPLKKTHALWQVAF